MKKTNLKKIWAIGLSAMLSLSAFAAAPAFAEPTENMPEELRNVVPFNIVITKTYSYLSVVSGQTLRCYAETSVASGNNAGLTMELQQKQNGKWQTIETWSNSGGTKTILDKTYTVSKGYSYQLKLTNRGFNSAWTLLETIPTTSNTISL